MKRTKKLKLAVLPNKRKCCCTPTTCICNPRIGPGVRPKYKPPTVKLTRADIKELKAKLKKIIDEVTNKIVTPAMFCDHANEVPMTCPCAPSCYCKGHTCKPRSARS